MAACGVGPAEHPYHRVGDADGDVLVVLPGVTDGLGWWNDPGRLTAAALSYYFRAYREYDVWVVSRPPGVPEGADAAALAAGYAEVLDEIGRAHVLGISLGGAIGAHLAAETDLVRRLVLVSCGAGLGAFGRQTVTRWRDLASQRRYRDLHLEYVRRVYAGYRRLVVPPLYRLGARWLPEPPVTGDVERACEAMLAYDGAVLSAVSVPALVVGGRRDSLVPRASHRLAVDRLGCPLALAPGGHAVYEESRRALASVVGPFLAGDRLTPR